MTGAVLERQSRRLTTHLMNAATLWIFNAVSVDLRHESGVVSGTRGSGGSSCLDRSASTKNGRDIPRWLCQPGGNQRNPIAVLPKPSRGKQKRRSSSPLLARGVVNAQVCLRHD